MKTKTLSPRNSRISKKAQGLPMEVIIIAVIALVVLAVLSVIFIGKIGGFGRSAADCAAKAKGAACLPKSEGCPANHAPISGLCSDDEFCCVPLTVEE